MCVHAYDLPVHGLMSLKSDSSSTLCILYIGVHVVQQTVQPQMYTAHVSMLHDTAPLHL
jgi:hypothetical protein